MTVPLHLEVALGELGVEEWPGAENNPRILEYLDATPVGKWSPYDRTSWCGAFVAWTMLEAYPWIQVPRNAHRAREWRKFGAEVEPGFGCVTQVKHKQGSDRRTGSWGGHHVGYYMDKTRGGIVLLSANVQDRVGIDFFSSRKWDVLAFRG